MARLQRGEDPKIDRINDLVATVKYTQSGSAEFEKGMTALLEQFKPMILGTCKKWSEYFNDSSHRIKPFNELVADAEYWFIHYTLFKYVIDGRATYNKFITDHINQRIRYIYECELKYYKNNIFPDPDKSSDPMYDGEDSFENVVHSYCSDSDNGFEDDYIDTIDMNCRIELAHHIIRLIDDSQCFNDRERLIFKEILYNGRTQEEMGRQLGISRTRIVQIIRKVRAKLYTIMNDDKEVWELIRQTDIRFDEK
jgi:biotin operon repressor